MLRSTIQPTPPEVAAALPGDDLVPDADVIMDRAFTLPAPPEQVWPWFMQLGKNRAGWYLPRWVERFVPPKNRALRSIDPQFQNLVVGKIIDDWGGPNETFEIAILEPARALVHKSRRGRTSVSWAITLRPERGNRTRVQLRLRLSPVRWKWLATTGGELIDVLTVACLAVGLRERLSGR